MPCFFVAQETNLHVRVFFQEPELHFRSFVGYRGSRYGGPLSRTRRQPVAEPQSSLPISIGTDPAMPPSGRSPRSANPPSPNDITSRCVGRQEPPLARAV